MFELIVGTEKQAITKEIFARNTVFGWVVSGKVSANHSTSFPQVHHVTSDDQLKRFWELEELPSVKHWTPEEKARERMFEETTELANQRFVVKLPFKESIELGDSLKQATKRFYYLEKRLDSKPKLKTGYQNFIHEYSDLDHMEEVPAADVECPPNKCFYLPHHCVFKEDSSTTKLRVV